MIQIKVRNNVFGVSEVPKQDDSLTKIDWLALKFYETKDAKYVDVLIQVAARYIRKVASSFCKNVEDARELDQELKIDLLRLLNDWEPKKEMRFNYLMRRQFYNFSCNFIKKIKVRKISFIDLAQVQEDWLSNTDLVRGYEMKNIVAKLMLLVDIKTKQVLQLFLKGITNYEQIGDALGVSGVMVRNRIKKCKPLLQKILEEQNVSN